MERNCGIIVERAFHDDDELSVNLASENDSAADCQTRRKARRRSSTDEKNRFEKNSRVGERLICLVSFPCRFVKVNRAETHRSLDEQRIVVDYLARTTSML
jgi:hypothetical protein